MRQGFGAAQREWKPPVAPPDGHYYNLLKMILLLRGSMISVVFKNVGVDPVDAQGIALPSWNADANHWLALTVTLRNGGVIIL